LAKDIKVTRTGDEGINAFADKNMINTVLRNLISNAIKFSFPNSTITVDVAQKDTMAYVSIIDTGIGVKPDIQKNIFKIKMLSTEGTQHEKGTGLGLAVCKDFVEKNDGEIWVKSKDGSGAVFTFTLPLDN
jgi:signal transduction histidine kinase